MTQYVLAAMSSAWTGEIFQLVKVNSNGARFATGARPAPMCLRCSKVVCWCMNIFSPS